LCATTETRFLEKKQLLKSPTKGMLKKKGLTPQSFPLIYPQRKVNDKACFSLLNGRIDNKNRGGYNSNTKFNIYTYISKILGGKHEN
jgi:hypothetical protein